MTTRVMILKDSITEVTHIRITTFALRYPRFIHAQMMTHRVFSRSVSSSRAVPVHKMIEDVINDPAYPLVWGENKKGMQAGEELSKINIDILHSVWDGALNYAVESARHASKIGLHKQHVNRLLEPFSHVNVVLTATDFRNFFDLRLGSHAQPEIRYLASLMNDAMFNSTPEVMRPGDWHIPYITEDEKSLSYSDRLMISAARCARVSYKMLDSDALSDPEKDKVLARDLLSNRHMSPFEHQAQATTQIARFANFRGWKQYRGTLDLSGEEQTAEYFKPKYRINY